MQSSDLVGFVRNENHLMELKNKFIERSVLNFTHELSIDNKLPFLDVLIDSSNRHRYLRSVYTKPTRSDDCINYKCDAPERYKTGVLKTLLHRANKICNTEEAFQEELDRIKRLLINNNFPNKLCDDAITRFCQRRKDQILSATEIRTDSSLPNQSPRSRSSDNNAVCEVINIYYRNQYHSMYKADEAALKKIVKNHVFQVKVKIKLCIYYRSKKIRDLIIKNNLTNPNVEHAEKSHLIYEFT